MVTRPPRTHLALGVPICGFTGSNGAGKTMLAAQSVIYDLARGRSVYSTVPVTSPWGSTQPIRSLRQLLELRDTTIFLDEVSVIFSSRNTQSLPAEIVAMLQTLRHRGNTVLWTAPGWMRCDNLLREVTQAVVNVVPLMRYHDPADPWPRPRFILAALMDTSTGKADAMPEKRLRTRIYAPRALASFGAYDTHADTPLLGRHLHTGVCVDCGGTVSREKHSRELHERLNLPWYTDTVSQLVREDTAGELDQLVNDTGAEPSTGELLESVG